MYIKMIKINKIFLYKLQFIFKHKYHQIFVEIVSYKQTFAINDQNQMFLIIFNTEHILL